MDSSKTQSGFGITIIVMAILVLGVLAYGGYRLYNHFSKPVSTNSAANSQTSVTNSNQSGNTQPAATYLDIKEMGIKFKLDDSIKDAIYVTGTGSDGGQYAHVSTQSLSDKSAGSCGLNGTPLASITKVSSANLVPNSTSIFKLGDNYFVIVGSQATCSEDTTIQSLANQQRATLLSDFKTVQLDK